MNNHSNRNTNLSNGYNSNHNMEMNNHGDNLNMNSSQSNLFGNLKMNQNNALKVKKKISLTNNQNNLSNISNAHKQSTNVGNQLLFDLDVPPASLNNSNNKSNTKNSMCSTNFSTENNSNFMKNNSNNNHMNFNNKYLLNSPANDVNYKTMHSGSKSMHSVIDISNSDKKEHMYDPMHAVYNQNNCLENNQGNYLGENDYPYEIASSSKEKVKQQFEDWIINDIGGPDQVLTRTKLGNMILSVLLDEDHNEKAKRKSIKMLVKTLILNGGLKAKIISQI